MRLSNEIQYVTADQKPFLKPVQLPSAPSQSLVAGTLNAYSTSGAPFSVAVTGQPTNGTVTIDSLSGSYIYTPNAELAASGGTDTFTITATDTGFHPLAALLGQPAHATTVTVPVTVAAASPAGTTGTTAYYVTNTAWETMQVAGYETNQATLSPAVGMTYATAESALFEIASGSSVKVTFNKIGVSHEGLLQTIPVGKTPYTVAVSPDGKTVYVPNNNSNNVSVIDTASGFIKATIGVGSGPYGVAISPDGSRVYVSNAYSNSVSVINAATNVVTATIGGVGGQPQLVAISPDGKRLYVNGYSGSAVYVIDTSSNAITATVGVGKNPNGVAVSPDGTRAYVAALGSNNVSVIDTATNTVTATIGIGSQPAGVAVSPDGSRVYVANTGSQNVAVIDSATNTVISAITIPASSNSSLADPVGVAVSPDGNRVYVTAYGAGTVSVINAATNAITSTIAIPCDGCQLPGLGRAPWGLAISSDGGRVYVADAFGLSVSVLGGVITGTTGDGGQAEYTVTMSGGSASCSSSKACAVAGTTIYLEDNPNTTIFVPSDQAQQQSDVLQDLVYNDLSNAKFTTKSSPTIGYTNALIPPGAGVYTNYSPDVTAQYTILASQSTTTTDSTQYNVSVKTSESVKLGDLGASAEQAAATTWGVSTADTQLYTWSINQTVAPYTSMYFFTETPVQRFYGDWSVRYGNTTYYLTDVWYNTPYKSDYYQNYLAGLPCSIGSTQCDELAAGNLDSYPYAFQGTSVYNTYPVGGSNTKSSYNSFSSALASDNPSSTRRLFGL